MQVPSPHLDLLTLNLNFKKILGDSCLSKVPLTQDYLESLRRGQVCQLNRKGLEGRYLDSWLQGNTYRFSPRIHFWNVRVKMQVQSLFSLTSNVPVVSITDHKDSCQTAVQMECVLLKPGSDTVTCESLSQQGCQSHSGQECTEETWGSK